MAAGLQLDLGFSEEDWFDTLVALNQRWLSSYARQHPSFGVSPSLLERNSVWMNTYFQRQRMITSPLSNKAKALVAQHQQTVLERLRSNGGRMSQSEAKGSTALVEPIAALTFAASADRCPEHHVESLLQEALELLQNRVLRALSLCAGFAGCVFRYLTATTETPKRILALRLLLLLATDDAAAVVHACKVAAHGQLWQPNMFIYTLQKRHCGNETICDLVSKLLVFFSSEMPISSPVKLDSDRHERGEHYEYDAKPSSVARIHTLPALVCPRLPNNAVSPHRPTTTISSLYVGNVSPYSPSVVLPIARPPPSAVEQTRRSLIYSTPKEKAIAGDIRRRCLTPNIIEPKRQPSRSDDLDWICSSTPSKSPPKQKKVIALSEKYCWSPNCINSVSSFEWWWRSLPEHHSSLEPTQKLKMVTRAAVRLHSKGDWDRAVELYLLALSMGVNEEVEFRLRVNLGCAYQVGHEHIAAEAEFRAAIRLNPEDPYTRFKLGSSLKELGQFDEAAAAFTGVIDAYPQAIDALQQLEHIREEQLRKDAAEREKVINARDARSPSKPGRRLHSHRSPRPTCLPHIPKAPITQTRALTPDATTNPEVSVGSCDLISFIEERSHQKRVDLRAALEEIDHESTGFVRFTPFIRLLSALCDVDERAIHSWLPHEAVPVSANGVVQYGALLDALDKDSRRKSEHGPHNPQQWIALVESIRNAEEAFYNSVSSRRDPSAVAADERERPVVLAACAVEDPSTRNSFNPAAAEVHSSEEEGGGRVEGDSVPLHRQFDQIAMELLIKLPDKSPTEGAIDGYHSVSARLDAKREKARQEAILRAERSRVAARKHLHCLKALQEFASRARRLLTEKHASEERTTIQGASGVDRRGLPTGVDLHSSEDDSENLLCERSTVKSSPAIIGEVTWSSESQEQGRESIEPASKCNVVVLLSERVVDLAVGEATRAVAAAQLLAEIQSLATAAASAALSAARRQIFAQESNQNPILS